MMKAVMLLAILPSIFVPTVAFADVTVSTFCSSSPGNTIGTGTGRTYSIAAQIAVAKCVAKRGNVESCKSNVKEVSR